ncbi:MAG TPA: histidinol dehydrogenase, partial [Candidatus Limnocylindrales bacterium]|nr:histidinol dehydrogenase [Candidatus Limnocylindrales bacterium]
MSLLRRLDLARAAEPEVAAEIARLVRRGAVPDAAAREAARRILDDVRRRGDAAVREANEAHGGGSADGRLLADPADLRAARDALPRDLRAALETMIEHVRRFHQPQLPRTTRTVVAPGIEIERRWTPLSRVGAYVPGGSAAYPSSLVMCAVPARVAGVGSLVVATPAGPDGRPSAVLLGCAGLLEVDALVVAGGAQAVGALAFGLPEAGL